MSSLTLIGAHRAVSELLENRPESWDVVRFKGLFERLDRRNVDLAHEMLSLRSTGEVVARAEMGGRQEPDEASLPKYLVAEIDDLVVNPMWLIGGGIGVSLRAGAVSPDYRVFRSRGALLPRFVHHLLRSQPYLDQYLLYTRAQTTFDRRVQQPDLDNLPLPVPPLEEQRAIADYLGHETARIDTLIEEQQRLIELLRERRLAAVEVAVSDVQTSGPRLKHIIQSVRQGWSPQCYAWAADGVEMWAVLKAGAANGGRFRPMENKELPSEETPRPGIVVRRGDLIVSRANTRELVGSAAVVDGDFPRLMLCDKLYAFTLDEHQALPRFVAAVLGSRRWRDLIELEATGASHSMLNVSQADIVNLPMPVPPIEEQRRLITRLDEQTTGIDRLIVEAEQFIELARERRSALITAAVTGQIDVREVA
ncbi:hypothetical protein ACFQ6S_26575 [Streptomyces sp. NPDC056479]|uniref:hypothetical protein n=1 Tax=Streptomyces sp. NPDC056479 TaxID=3345832 RepID=UPI00369F9C62